MKRQPIALWLIRCGQTIWGPANRIQGASDLPLSAAGRADALEQARQFSVAKPAAIHHPPDEAATETATIFAKSIGAKAKSSPELSDPHLGVLEGMTLQEFEERFPSRHKHWEEDFLTLAPPEGEDVVHAANRIFKAVAKILQRSRGDEVAIVLHETGFALMRAWLARRPLAEFRALQEDAPMFEKYVVEPEMIAALAEAAVVKE